MFQRSKSLEQKLENTFADMGKTCKLHAEMIPDGIRMRTWKLLVDSLNQSAIVLLSYAI